MQTHPDHQLDTLLRASLTGKHQRQKVWYFLRDPDHPYRAEPILVIVQIAAEHNQLVWHPVKGYTVGADHREVDLETLKGDRVWWGPWPRKFAAARLRVEQERQALVQCDADKALAGHDAWEKGLARTTARALSVLTQGERQVLRDRYGLDGDREIRVIAEFPPARGYES